MYLCIEGWYLCFRISLHPSEVTRLMWLTGKYSAIRWLTDECISRIIRRWFIYWAHDAATCLSNPHTSIHPSTLAHILFISILFHKRESSIRFSRLCARHHNKKNVKIVCKNKIWDFKYMLGVNRGLKNERFSVFFEYE